MRKSFRIYLHTHAASFKTFKYSFIYFPDKILFLHVFLVRFFVLSLSLSLCLCAYLYQRQVSSLHFLDYYLFCLRIFMAKYQLFRPIKWFKKCMFLSQTWNFLEFLDQQHLISSNALSNVNAAGSFHAVSQNMKKKYSNINLCTKKKLAYDLSTKIMKRLDKICILKFYAI